MEIALTHPELGYYMNRNPFGASGDFTTAPEISQMFGELIGLWAAEVWSSMGSPNPVHLVELGPGRGTLMSDALRAARIVPEFRAALDVWLMESSPTLATMQHELLLDSGVAVAWAQKLGEVPAGPSIVIGNEFLDALPVRQFVRVGGQWRERTVRVSGEGNLVFDVAKTPEPYIQGNAPNGEVLEVNPSGHRFMFELGARLVKQGGAALLVDYGHSVTGLGDTLRPCGRTAMSTLSPRRGTAISPPMWISPPWRAAPAPPGRRSTGRSTRGIFCERSASTSGPERWPTGRTRSGLRSSGTPATALSERQGRDGGALQDDGGREPQAAAPAGLSSPPGARRRERRSLPLRRFLEAAGSGARLLHPKRRRLQRRLRLAQRRGRLARFARRRSPKTAPGWPLRSALRPDRLAVPYQVHSADAIAVSGHWAADARPRCDGVVTATPGLALGVTGADCGMILFADPKARVVGAAHAGWKGALSGVVEATVAAMARLGAARSASRGAWAPASRKRPMKSAPSSSPPSPPAKPDGRFFIPSRNAGHSMFDLKAYIGERAARAGVGHFEDSGSTPTPTTRSSSATAGRPIAGSPTTAGSSRRLR